VGLHLGHDPDGDRDDHLVLAEEVRAEHGMTDVKPATATVDLSTLPDYSFGATSVGFWGVFAFMLIEGMGFAMAIGAYFYLLPYEHTWPPTSTPPPLFWSTAGVIVIVLSEIPNVLSVRCAKAFDAKGTQLWLVVISLVGIALIVLRGLEFDAFNVRWDRNAYASICWALLIMHFIDLLTDVYDSMVLGALAILHPLDGRRFSDVEDNALFWHFVVVTWVLVYVLVYWVPRWT
jgi:heme/copper-type cytochrome/quinol oxidase subunit 3